MRDHILAKQVQIKRHDIPVGWSIEAADFMTKLIQRKPTNRLGLNGPSEVKRHPWLRHFPWEELKRRKLRAPFIPAVSYQISKFLSKKIILITRIRTVSGRTKTWKQCIRVWIYSGGIQCKTFLVGITTMNPFLLWVLNTFQIWLLRLETQPQQQRQRLLSNNDVY